MRGYQRLGRGAPVAECSAPGKGKSGITRCARPSALIPFSPCPPLHHSAGRLYGFSGENCRLSIGRLRIGNRSDPTQRWSCAVRMRSDRVLVSSTLSTSWGGHSAFDAPNWRWASLQSLNQGAAATNSAPSIAAIAVDALAAETQRHQILMLLLLFRVEEPTSRTAEWILCRGAGRTNQGIRPRFTLRSWRTVYASARKANCGCKPLTLLCLNGCAWK
jgi:hypothetical protein